MLSRAMRQHWLRLGSPLKQQEDKASALCSPCAEAGGCQEHPLQEEEEGSSQHRALNCWECSEPCTGPGWGCQELSWPLP